MGEAAIGTRKLIVEVVGDSRSLERSFARSSRATRQFGDDVTGTVATVDRGFTRMQRTLAGGFIGGAVITGTVAGIRTVVSAAAESEQVLGQTQVALEGAGLSWERYGRAIESAIQAQSRLGFNDEALLRTFSLFVRQTGDVEEALRRNNIAMDVARARFIDVEQAALLVNKAALGQAGALRRLGIDARTGASGVELLTLLEQQFGGAAEEASGTATAAMERFQVAAENAQESIGRLLLPAVTSLAEDVTSGADAVQKLADNLGDLANIAIPVIEVPLRLVGLDGGGDGGSDLGAAAKKLATGSLPGIIGLLDDAIRGEGIFAPPKPPNESQLSAQFDQRFAPFTNAVITAGRNAAANSREKISRAFGEPGFKIVPNELGATLQAKFEDDMDRLDLNLDRAAVTAGIADDLAVADQIIDGILKQIETHGHTVALDRRLFDARQDRARILRDHDQQQQRAAQDARDRARRRREERARAAEEAREAAAEAAQVEQFRSLGLSATGDKPIPTAANLRKQISQLTDRLVDEGEMTPKIRAQLRKISAAIRKAGDDITPQTRETIRDMIGDIRQGIGEELNKDLVPDIRVVSLSDKILNALGFGKDADVAGKLGADTRGLSRMARTAVTAPPPQVFTGAITVVADNPDAFLREMQKKANRTTATARGRFPGRSLGLG